MNKQIRYERYQRQILLKEFGVEGQDKLSNAKVLVIGAGGLGCPALQYLAAAGVGTIGIVDFDTVELSNLQRQTLYQTDDVGKMKSACAAAKLRKLNSDIQINEYHFILDNKNAFDLLDKYDIILDGTDNFATRYLVNDACMLLGKPLVYGAVLRFEGQVGVFNFSGKQLCYKTNYRDIFPKPPLPSSVPSCNDAGVLGVLPGIIGTMQAAEVIKIITGIGKPLCNKIFSYNLLNNQFYEIDISPYGNEEYPIPKNRQEFENYDYEWLCGTNRNLLEISKEVFDELRANEKILIIDVREMGESPDVHEFPFIQIPLSRFEKTIEEYPIKNKIVLFCQSGKRSLSAAKILKEKYPDYEVYSLKGGIEDWKKQQLNMKFEKK